MLTVCGAWSSLGRGAFNRRRQFEMNTEAPAPAQRLRNCRRIRHNAIDICWHIPTRSDMLLCKDGDFCRRCNPERTPSRKCATSADTPALCLSSCVASGIFRHKYQAIRNALVACSKRYTGESRGVTARRAPLRASFGSSATITPRRLFVGQLMPVLE